MTIGERIRDYRKQANLTQKELGEKLGVSNVHIGQYERGVRNPKLPQLKRIADALDIPFDLLVSDKVASLVDTSKKLDPGIMQAFEQQEFEEKLSHIGCTLTKEGSAYLCFPREGEPITLTSAELERINNQANSYLRFLLSEIRDQGSG